MSKEITIRLDIDEKQEEALRELLTYWQQYEGKDGSRPFENWTIVELLKHLCTKAVTTQSGNGSSWISADKH